MKLLFVLPTGDPNPSPFAAEVPQAYPQACNQRILDYSFGVDRLQSERCPICSDPIRSPNGCLKLVVSFEKEIESASIAFYVPFSIYGSF